LYPSPVLLLDDDDELPATPDEAESELTAQLGETGLRALDEALCAHAERRWPVILVAASRVTVGVDSDALCESLLAEQSHRKVAYCPKYTNKPSFEATQMSMMPSVCALI
jgi:hypothetical protein